MKRGEKGDWGDERAGSESCDSSEGITDYGQ